MRKRTYASLRRQGAIEDHGAEHSGQRRFAPTCSACSVLLFSAEAVILFDQDRRVIEWNPTAEKLYGYARCEAVGQELRTVPRHKEEELNEMIARVKGGEKILDVETQRLAKNGNPIDVSLSLTYFESSDAGGGFFIEVTKDIREKIKMRQKLIEMEKLTSMGKMAAGTAHHLNTPLTSMLLRVQMLKDSIKDQSLLSELERLERGIKFCQGFVQELLQFARGPCAQKKAEDLREIIDSVITFFRPTFRIKNVNVEVATDNVQDKRILADRSQIEALISSLLMNSLDALPNGGEIKIKLRSLSSDELEVRISDDGIGIPKAHLPYVFEPFYTTKEPGKGTGLGLSIARNITKEHGGSIAIKSREGKGTTVILRFPIYGGPRSVL